MDTSLPDSLTFRQKAWLAFSVVAVYWPIRLYQNIPGVSTAFLIKGLPFLVVEGILTFLLFLGWVYIIDEIQRRFVRWFSRGDTGELRWPTRLLTLLLAVGLALLFNELFGTVRRGMDDGLTRQFPSLGQSPQRSRPSRDAGQRERMNNGLTFLALLSAFYLTANRWSAQRIRQLQVKGERLEKEAVRSQFDALKNQVNPHFLFNSLSILSSLVEADARLAVQFIGRLSKAYRYILEQRDNEQVSLRTELDFITAYTFLLTIRFEDKLFVDIEVPEAARDRYAIAPLTLQLLVENAVKHNRLSEEQPLRVSIALEGDWLRVANRIQPRPAREESTGIGLQNIINRYHLLTERPVWVGEENGEFVVKLPLLNERVRE
jgi:two-component system LytT family sensor kinase